MWQQLILRGDEQLLDVGCGDGQLTEMMAQALPRGHATGIDLSSSMIALANEHTQSNLNFEVRDAHAIEEEARYDIITASSSLHWVPRLEEAIAKIYRALKPGGRFALVTYSHEGGFTQMERELLLSPKWRARARPGSTLNTKTATEHAEIFKQFDWTFTLTKEERTCPISEDRLRKNFDVFGPLLIEGSTADQQQFANELIERLRPPTGPFQMQLVTLKIFAQKHG